MVFAACSYVGFDEFRESAVESTDGLSKEFGPGSGGRRCRFFIVPAARVIDAILNRMNYEKQSISVR
jgi:hypothetical protein